MPSLSFSPSTQAPTEDPYVKMFSSEQVTSLAHMFKKVIDTYSDDVSQNQQSEEVESMNIKVLILSSCYFCSWYNFVA